jgi:hypothetical protein
VHNGPKLTMATGSFLATHLVETASQAMWACPQTAVGKGRTVCPLRIQPGVFMTQVVASNSTMAGSLKRCNSACRKHGAIPEQMVRCTCTFCANRGVPWACCGLDQFHLTSPASGDVIFRWHSKMVAHNQCPDCCCGTRRGSPTDQSDGGWHKTTRQIGAGARQTRARAAAPRTWPQRKHQMNKITIISNGPCLVEGSIPLTQMHIVVNEQGESVVSQFEIQIVRAL